MYWRRTLYKYIDVAGHSINNGTGLDIQDWIPTYLTVIYRLDTTGKKKHVMQVQDLYMVLHAHWTRGSKPRYDQSRVEISLILLSSHATAIRLGTLIESGSKKHSDKVLLYGHISNMRLRDVRDPSYTTTTTTTTTILIMDLVHV
ncbi:hypothetical protein AOQ84DRAFT_201616 [Glonium stellatum]|uniref:Uncharacterized protein n=1 Tax=Glonium stellatum TaxID=574774 RepID=A0A8E2F5S5_9PEZI|nr:hypothetical protein AOQ84DRAFT_201616 [Glonium stellatum]